jgi:predicted ester cyclase
LVAEGDTVAVWHTHSGTHGGDFAGIPATGKQVIINGLELLRISDGQIAEFWHMDDFAGMLQQISAE